MASFWRWLLSGLVSKAGGGADIWHHKEDYWFQEAKLMLGVGKLTVEWILSSARVSLQALD